MIEFDKAYVVLINAVLGEASHLLDTALTTPSNDAALALVAASDRLQKLVSLELMNLEMSYEGGTL